MNTLTRNEIEVIKAAEEYATALREFMVDIGYCDEDVIVLTGPRARQFGRATAVVIAEVGGINIGNGLRFNVVTHDFGESELNLPASPPAGVMVEPWNSFTLGFYPE